MSGSDEKQFHAILRQLVRVLFLASFALTAFVAEAQTFQVLYNFTGGATGYYPSAGIVRDQAGNLYGTTAYGGNYTLNCNFEGVQTGCGLVYKLSQHGPGWIFDVLAGFNAGNGYLPQQLVAAAPDGSLYGSTEFGGSNHCTYFWPGCGIVYRLQPPATFCHSVSCPWTVDEVHEFLGQPGDGAFPTYGSLTFDSAGNIYGTAETGGLYSDGIVYELSPSPNGWTMSVLHTFGGGDGENPRGGVVFDNAGNLYGTTLEGGDGGAGVVYELTPTGSGWAYHVLYSFNYESGPQEPTGNLIIDASGNLYGTTNGYSGFGSGSVWELSAANGSWNLSVLAQFEGLEGPLGGLLMDQAGNLYGASFVNYYGNVFELSPSASGWTYTSLHDFTDGSDGGRPYSNLAIDSLGNLYGVASGGGSQNCADGCGLVFEITP